MKITIGTPTHESKGYGTCKWLDSVRAMQWHEPIPLYVVDNSNTPEFFEKMKGYAESIRLDTTHFYWLDWMIGKDAEARRRDSREKFREEILKTDAEMWLSWECDIIAPPDALYKLESLFPYFDSICNSYPSRENKQDIVGGIGFALFRRELLEQFSFLTGGGYGVCNEENQNCHYSGDSWFVHRALHTGYRHLEAFNLVELDHLGM